jgi:protein tyrosine phosphatase (PTP) superfamily phosphohydrolase (DUF442 family)
VRLPVLQVSFQLYRSPQPDFEDLLALRERGIKALVNLREEADESAFFARQAKLEYLYLPVTDWRLPTYDQVGEFLGFVGQTYPALVHCAAGVGRTGTFVSCYRVSKGMDVETAIELTNSETPLPGVTMNQIQMEFVREWSAGFHGAG